MVGREKHLQVALSLDFIFLLSSVLCPRVFRVEALRSQGGMDR